MKKKFDTAKIVVDWKCNLTCSYCCNKLPEVVDSFRPLKLEDVGNLDYKDYCLTGGEVLLPDVFEDKLLRVMNCIPFDGNIYIYTNGTLITNDTIGWYGEILSSYNIKGINVGVHNHTIDWDAIYKMHSLYFPVRVWIKHGEDWKVPNKYKFINKCKSKPFEYRFWDEGDCNKITTDRFFMRGL